MKQQSFAIWWIPAFILAFVLYPKNLTWNTVYIEFAMPVVGIFILWLLIVSLLSWKKNTNEAEKYKRFFMINVLLLFTYNPFFVSYSLSTLLANENFRYFTLLNLFCAALLIYQWWKIKKS